MKRMNLSRRERLQRSKSVVRRKSAVSSLRKRLVDRKKRKPHVKQKRLKMQKKGLSKKKKTRLQESKLKKIACRKRLKKWRERSKKHFKMRSLISIHQQRAKVKVPILAKVKVPILARVAKVKAKVARTHQPKRVKVMDKVNQASLIWKSSKMLSTTLMINELKT